MTATVWIGVLVAALLLLWSRRPWPRWSRLAQGPLELGAGYLRRPRPEDLRPLLETIDDEVRRINGWTDVHVKRFAVVFQRRLEWRGERWIICLADRRVVGSIAVGAFDRRTRSAELGLWMTAEARGRGLARDAVRALVRELAPVGIDHFRIGTEADNVAMLRVLDRVGAELVRRGPHLLPDGGTIEGLWYRLPA